jgi:hypothetical protein
MAKWILSRCLETRFEEGRMGMMLELLISFFA